MIVGCLVIAGCHREEAQYQFPGEAEGEVRPGITIVNDTDKLITRIEVQFFELGAAAPELDYVIGRLKAHDYHYQLWYDWEREREIKLADPGAVRANLRITYEGGATYKSEVFFPAVPVVFIIITGPKGEASLQLTPEHSIEFAPFQ